MPEATEVAAAVTYSPGKDRFLVLKRADSMDVFPDRWDFPSGKVEDDEPEKAALRELREETGLSGQVIRSGDPFTVESEYGCFRVHPFLVMVESDDVDLNREHTDYRWIGPGELEDLETVKGLERDLESVGVLDG